MKGEKGLCQIAIAVNLNPFNVYISRIFVKTLSTHRQIEISDDARRLYLDRQQASDSRAWSTLKKVSTLKQRVQMLSMIILRCQYDEVWEFPGTILPCQSPRGVGHATLLVSNPAKARYFNKQEDAIPL